MVPLFSPGLGHVWWICVFVSARMLFSHGVFRNWYCVGKFQAGFRVLRRLFLLCLWFFVGIFGSSGLWLWLCLFQLLQMRLCFRFFCRLVTWWKCVFRKKNASSSSFGRTDYNSGHRSKGVRIERFFHRAMEESRLFNAVFRALAAKTTSHKDALAPWHTPWNIEMLNADVDMKYALYLSE